VNRNRVVEQREQLAKELEQHKANLHATSGAIQILDKLLNEMDAESKEVAANVEG